MNFFKSFSCFTISDKVADCSTTDDAIATTTSRTFSWNDLKKRTNDFATPIASGGFSTVYLARHPDSAVKFQFTCTDRLSRIHHQELQILTRLKPHPNIIKFLGHSTNTQQQNRHNQRDDKQYHQQDERAALVFEYASTGTLHDNLKNLSWKTRKLIAFQLATALEYLHSVNIIHCDIKSSNVLLDQNLNCKLCDFGSAKFTFTSMVSPPSSTKTDRMTITGSQGYIDPHYLKTGLVSKKNDVYSYGVVLLELVTGREAFSDRREKLSEVMGPVVDGVVGVAEVVDPRLRFSDGFDLEEVEWMVGIAGKCIGCSPAMVRPCVSEIVASMKGRFQSVAHL